MKCKFFFSQIWTRLSGTLNKGFENININEKSEMMFSILLYLYFKEAISVTRLPCQQSQPLTKACTKVHELLPPQKCFNAALIKIL
jgi:hypothetical protein